MARIIDLLRRCLPRRWRSCRAGDLPAPGSARGASRSAGWAAAWCSRTGPHHLNQDCAGARWRLLPDGHGLAAAVADGVTHGAAGDVAALALVQHWLQGPRPSQRQHSFLAAAEQAVTGALRQLTEEPGAATGAACWLQADGSGWATRVGDCRLLRVCPPAAADTRPRWEVQALLPDQTYAALWQQSGLLSPPHADDAGQPAHMVGVGCLGEPEWLPLSLENGDVLLLASDGLHGVLEPGDWHAALAAYLGPDASLPVRHPERVLQALGDHLIQTAIERGSEDDITVLAIQRCPQERPQEEFQP